MTLPQEFHQAAQRVKELTSRPTNEELLTLYALYKQATEGDVQGKRPGMLDVKGRAKYDTWKQKKGVSKQEAGQQYITYVEKMVKKYS